MSILFLNFPPGFYVCNLLSETALTIEYARPSGLLLSEMIHGNENTYPFSAAVSISSAEEIM